MPDDERIEQLELENKVLQANNKGLKDTIDELRDKLDEKNAELEKEKEKNKNIEANSIDAELKFIAVDKIKAKIEELKSTGQNVCVGRRSYGKTMRYVMACFLEELLEEEE